MLSCEFAVELLNRQWSSRQQKSFSTAQVIGRCSFVHKNRLRKKTGLKLGPKVHNALAKGGVSKHWKRKRDGQRAVTEVSPPYYSSQL